MSLRPRLLSALSLSLTGLATYTVGALYPPAPLTLLAPRTAPAPPAPGTPAARAHTAALEDALQALPLLAAHRARPDAAAWSEARPYRTMPAARRANSLVAGALAGPGRLALPAVVRVRGDGGEAAVFVHVGRGVCGHEGIVHGGLLATLLDESLARVALANLPAGVGVTANLAIDYRAPTRADQFIVLKIRLIEAKSRKAVVSGRVEDMRGAVLAEATATFVQPKYAKLLDRTAIEEAMGEPVPVPEKP